jgi:hypothetical protein
MSAVSTAIPVAQHAPPPPVLAQLPSQPVPTFAHAPAYILSVANLAPSQQPRVDDSFVSGVQASALYTLAAVSQVAAVQQPGIVSWSVDTTARVGAIAAVAASQGAAVNSAAVADSAANARAAATAARDGVGTVSPPLSTDATINDSTAPWVNVFA